MTDPRVRLIKPDKERLADLLPVARRIFTETFKHLYESDEFELFCDAVYLPDGSMSRDFDDPEVLWQVALVDNKPIGYAKLTSLRAPFRGASRDALELQQIYVLSEWHGTGVAASLMEWAQSAARSRQAKEMYLTVFDHNHRAKRFYARYGFVEVGRCNFKIGKRVDDDRIWRLFLGTK